MTPAPRIARTAPLAWAALALWASALLGLGAALEGYSHTTHPIALLGAQGVPRAMAFNIVAFVIPGLLMAAAALELRGGLDARGWPARVGAHLLMLSALAFAAQGVAPLDPGDLDAPASRVHATIWSLWWIAYLPGVALLSMGSRRLLLLAVIALALAAISAVLLPGALAQRCAVALWFVLGALGGRALGPPRPAAHAAQP